MSYGSRVRSVIPGAESTVARKLALLLVMALSVSMSGCEHLRKSTDNAEVETGPRFDEDGRFTREPEVKVPMWRSGGLKEKPQDVMPNRK